MSILQYIQEQFYDANTIENSMMREKKFVEIFKNPTPREMMSIVKSQKEQDSRFSSGMIRWAVDENGDLFAWMADIFHKDVANYLGKNWVIRGTYVAQSPETSIENMPATMMPYDDWNKIKDGVLKKLKLAIPGLKRIKATALRFNDNILWDDEEGWVAEDVGWDAP